LEGSAADAFGILRPKMVCLDIPLNLNYIKKLFKGIGVEHEEFTRLV
jgi:hypothetical protein